MADIGANGAEEPPIITCGTDVSSVTRMTQAYGTVLTAQDVMAVITGLKRG